MQRNFFPIKKVLFKKVQSIVLLTQPTNTGSNIVYASKMNSIIFKIYDCIKLSSGLLNEYIEYLSIIDYSANPKSSPTKGLTI